MNLFLLKLDRTTIVLERVILNVSVKLSKIYDVSINKNIWLVEYTNVFVLNQYLLKTCYLVTYYILIYKLQTGCNTVINQYFTKYETFRSPLPLNIVPECVRLHSTIIRQIALFWSPRRGHVLAWRSCGDVQAFALILLYCSSFAIIRRRLYQLFYYLCLLVLR